MTKFTTTAQDGNASEPLPDGGRDVSAVFSRFCELAIADGDVPDDGSGFDGVWTRTIEARKRDRDWNVAVNAETERDLEVDDFPREGDSTSVSSGSAVVFLGAWPAGVVDPVGGQVVVEELDDGPQSLEDEILRDVETELLDAGADIDRTIPDQEIVTDGGVGIERQHIVAPEDGTLTIAINGTEHEYALEEGDDVVFEWQERLR